MKAEGDWAACFLQVQSLGAASVVACSDPLELAFASQKNGPRLITHPCAPLLCGARSGGVLLSAIPGFHDTPPLADHQIFVATASVVDSPEFEQFCTRVSRGPDRVLPSMPEPATANERNDAFTALRAAPGPGRFLRDVSFAAGSAIAWFDAFACVRGLSMSEQFTVLSDAALVLRRWRPLKLRVPQTGMSCPTLWLRYSGPDKAPPPEVQVPGGPAGILVNHHDLSTGRHLSVTFLEATDHLVDIEVAGHGVCIEGFGVALDVAGADKPFTAADPLVRFSPVRKEAGVGS